MSNILIIKHGSLGDIAQISGAIQDIRENHKDKKIFILTTLPYTELLSMCPYTDGVLIDKRLPRWNILYLLKLKKMLKKFNFSEVFDLQNSSRTLFYRKFLLHRPKWSSTKTILKKKEKKSDFDKMPVLERFEIQLKNSDIRTNYTLKPDFSWAKVNVDKITNQYLDKKFILLMPFCSSRLAHKKWPHFNELIKIIKLNHPNLELVTAPGPLEIEEAGSIEALKITKQNKSLNIMELTGLIHKASFVVSNDTGPAHIAAHLGKRGVVLFGYHTSAEKVSIETEKFHAITVDRLELLKAETVYSKIKSEINLIN